MPMPMPMPMHVTQHADAIRRVILLHGLWMAGVTMWPLARRLRKQGFAPEILAYRSIGDPPQTAMERLLGRLREGGPAHVVGHSLGGLVALHALRSDPAVAVGRVLCLGSPLCGSGAAQRLAGFRLSQRYFGHSCRLLLEGCAALPEGVQVGVIAGSSPRGLGHLFGRFQGAHDGTVAVMETRTPGVADHLVLRTSHMGMLLSARVARQAGWYLAEGRFHRAPAP